MVAVQGWELFAHPLLLDQLDKLVSAVEREKAKKPKTYQTGANAKLLAALRRLIFEVVPQDPARAEYRQGATLGADRKHWFRDETTLRAYGAKTDAYAVFRGMLDKETPPDSWDALLKAARAEAAAQRIADAG
jgi:toxin YhaV